MSVSSYTISLDVTLSPFKFPGAISTHKQIAKSDITKVCTKQFQGIPGTKLRFHDTRTGAEILVKLMS